MRKLARFFSRFLVWLFGLAPQGLGSFASRVMTFLWVDVLRLRRRVVFDNIEIAFPGTDEHTKLRWMRESIFVLAKSLFDLLLVPKVTKKWVDQNVIFHGAHNLERVKDSGVLFLTLHMASGDLAAAAISEAVKPLSLITKRMSSAFTDEFWFSIRRRSRTEFIDAHAKNNAFEILKALKKKRGVVFVLDQFMGQPYGLETLFFGRATGTAYGLALFARKTRLPVYPLFSYRDARGRLNICIKPPVDLSSYLQDHEIRDGGSEQPVSVEADPVELNRQIINRLNVEIENIIKQHPEQWMWVHKRWKVFE